MASRLMTKVSGQLSRPSGRFGRIVAALMNRGNREMNKRAIDLLDVRPGTRVLDLGFGGGLTFAPLLDRGAVVVGVDRAADMVEAARARHGDRVTVHVGEVQSLPLEDRAVDRVLTVNTVYFWRDLGPAFREVRRVLAPGGRLVVGTRDASVMARVDPAVFTLREPDELATALRSAGFPEVEVVSPQDAAMHFIVGSG